MTKTLNTKQGSEWTNDDGVTFPAAPLYRFEDENGEGGCWYSTVEQAETSWNRWVESKPARERRRAEAAALRARVEAASAADEAREQSGDPFARLGY